MNKEKDVEKETLVVNGEEVILDPSRLHFSEQTLSDYLKREAGWYDNLGAYLARAERELQSAEAYFDSVYSLKFFEFKEQGGSDKTVDARANLDKDVQDAWKGRQAAKYAVARLKNHLRAWDKNHENAQSMGHTLRREANRIGNDIHGGSSNYDAYGDIDEIVEHLDPSGIE